MADVDIIPKIRCDNCGFIQDKTKEQHTAYRRPRSWGSCKMEGGRSTDSYGGKAMLAMPDLCEPCANAAIDAAAEALKSRRGES